jgi:mRNA-degrading endonuclease YafQ of YafQ-DinJ toxin-antitoxin module
VKPQVWSSSFTRAFRHAVRLQLGLRPKIERTLRQLAEDPFDPVLHSHKLKGELTGARACTVGYENRILLEFVQGPESGEEEIHLLTMGTHDEVY